MNNQTQFFDLGRNLLKELDKRRETIKAAFWYLNPEEKAWQFILASPLSNSGKKKELYNSIWEILHSERSDGFTDGDFARFFSDIHVTSEDDEIVRLLRTAIKTGAEDISGIRFKSNVINGQYIEDAYIYRLS